MDSPHDDAWSEADYKALANCTSCGGYINCVCIGAGDQFFDELNRIRGREAFESMDETLT